MQEIVKPLNIPVIYILLNCGFYELPSLAASVNYIIFNCFPFHKIRTRDIYRKSSFTFIPYRVLDIYSNLLILYSRHRTSPF